MRSTTVSGSFYDKTGRPVSGIIAFVPERLWVIQKRVAYACLAPRVVLGQDGSFIVDVTATDSDSVPWKYQVFSPAGKFTLHVPWNEMGWSLRDLIQTHQPGAAH